MKNMINAEHLTLPSAGLTIAADRWGKGNPKGRMILLHGGGQTRHSWARTARNLARDGWDCVNFDLRGHGDSGWGNYRMSDFVADARAVAEAIGGPAVLVGASLGGLVSLLTAAERPELVRALVLVDISTHMEPVGLERIKSFLTAYPDGFASLEEVAVAIQGYNPGRKRDTNLAGLTKNVRQRPDGRWHWHWDPALVGQLFDNAGAEAVGRIKQAARKVEAPTLMIRAEGSDIVSDASQDELKALIPHVECVTIAKTGHMLVGDDNDAFSQALKPFLERSDAAV
jgi:pimeloyl-ACP methyl ester carboxylesterase